jgi:hypothetical protein
MEISAIVFIKLKDVIVKTVASFYVLGKDVIIFDRVSKQQRIRYLPL